MRVNAASTERYKENKIVRERKLKTATEKYRTNETLSLRTKALSKKQYDTNSEVRSVEKSRVYEERVAQKGKLKNEEEVKIFVVLIIHVVALIGFCFKFKLKNVNKPCMLAISTNTNVAELCIQEKYPHNWSDSCPKNCINPKL